MNLKELKKIISLFEDANITELELEEEGVRVKLKKGTEGKENSVVVQTEPGNIPRSPKEAAESGETDQHLQEIVSPMVGTFYRAPSPETSAFVEVGDEVGEDDAVCIIEAMKIMNEIKAETKGKVTKVLVENGEAVQFGQALFLIEPLT